MKICLDGFGISNLEGTGLYSYSYSLINQLTRYYPQGEYHLLWDNSKNLIFESIKEINLAKLKVNRIHSDFSSLENYLRNREISVYHSPNNGFSVPSNKICKYVMTAHDLIVLGNERYVDERYKRKFLTSFPASIKIADKIIAVSNSIKRELLTYFLIPEDKIEVIYPTSTLCVPETDNLNIKNLLMYKYNIEEPFILFTGSIHQRKNLRTLLTAFKTVVKKYPKLKLVIVGKTDGKRTDYFNSLISFINLLEIRNSVIFTGMVPINDMYYFYTQCKCFVNLSEYEGFPLTSLEAIQCKAPVICSNIASMKEVVGDGGILIDQRSEKQITDNILMLMNDYEYREKLKFLAYKQSRNFEPYISAKKLINLYEKLL